MSDDRGIAIRVVSGAEVRSLLTYRECIELIRPAMIAVSRRAVSMPLRHGLPLPTGRGVLGMMYGYLGEPESFGIKLASFFPQNLATGLSTHMGLLVLYDAANGKPVAIMEAGAVTAIRTAAASAAATERLARAEAATLAILGTGEQAAAHAHAIPCVRSIGTIRVWGRAPESARRFAECIGKRIGSIIEPVATVAAATADADIICTATAAAEPILEGRMVALGTHLNLVGSSVPDRAEVDTALVLRSRFFVDSRESAMAQAGEFLKARRDGAVTDSHIVGEIGQVFAGELDGRRSRDEITVYKSLGVIAQDLAAATAIWHAAEARNVGQVVAI